METLRITKIKEEIKRTTKACKITSDVFKKTLKNFKNFRTEADVRAFIDNEIKKQGAELAFKTIVASGKNASQPHHETSDERLRKGFCVMDFGAKYKGYCADMTRTIYLGKPSKKEIKLYNTLLKIQKDSIKIAKVGKKCSDIDKYSRDAMKDLAKYFIHSLGHGTGLDIHEAPSLGPRSKDKLQNGMIITIEPGVYFTNKLGIRIEDTLLIKKKAVSLTTANKHLITVKK